MIPFNFNENYVRHPVYKIITHFADGNLQNIQRDEISSEAEVTYLFEFIFSFETFQEQQLRQFLFVVFHLIFMRF